MLALALGSPSLKLGVGLERASAPSRRACLPATLAHTAALAGTGVDVSPAPETDTRQPAHADQLPRRAGGARSTTSRSSARTAARHAGRLRGYSQGDGASFVPDTPFDAGERVDGARRDRRGAGKPVAFGFRVDTPVLDGEHRPTFPNPPAAPADYQSFYTLPGVQAAGHDRHRARPRPGGRRHLHDQRPRPGPVRAADLHARRAGSSGSSSCPAGEAAENLSEQTYEGQRVLTWWKGRVLSLGFGQGEDVVMNSRYQTIARVAGGNGLKADLHDFQHRSRTTSPTSPRTTRSAAT